MTNIHLLGQLQVNVLAVTNDAVHIRFMYANQRIEMFDYGFKWDGDIDNGAVIWGDLYQTSPGSDYQVAFNDSIGSDWSISRNEVAMAVSAMIHEFDDGEMGIDTDPLYESSGFKACGLLDEIIEALTKMDAPGFLGLV
jgi:hypothetical protein